MMTTQKRKQNKYTERKYMTMQANESTYNNKKIKENKKWK